ncbi:MAG: class I SAM-dependent methyltransferase [Solirubrobacterales bacterium]
MFAREGLLRGGVIDQVREATSGIASPRVLELGCGTGSLALALAESLKSASIEGLDLDPVALSIARRKRGSDGVEWSVGNVLDEPPAPGSWDCVVISLVLHHLMPADQPIALSRAFTALRPGGTLHVVDFAPPGNRIARLGWPILQRIDGVENTTPLGLGALPLMIDDSGFSDRKLIQRYNTIFGTNEQYRAIRAA